MQSYAHAVSATLLSHSHGQHDVRAWLARVLLVQHNMHSALQCTAGTEVLDVRQCRTQHFQRNPCSPTAILTRVWRQWRVAAMEAMMNWNDTDQSQQIKVVKTILHPGEVRLCNRVWVF